MCADLIPTPVSDRAEFVMHVATGTETFVPTFAPFSQSSDDCTFVSKLYIGFNYPGAMETSWTSLYDTNGNQNFAWVVQPTGFGGNNVNTQVSFSVNISETELADLENSYGLTSS